jgi:integrase
MATVKRTDGPRGPRWIVRYHRPDGTTTQKSFRKSGLAHDYATEVEDTKRRGSYVDPARSKLTFSQMADLWREAMGHADTTIAARESDLKNHVMPVLGHLPLHQLRPLQLEHLLRQLERDLKSADTVKRVWGWVVSILAAAVRDERLTSNPAKGLKPKKPKARKVVPLEQSQVTDLIAALPAHHQALAKLAAGAGLRLGEVLGLRPTDVSWLSGSPVIHVQRQLVCPVGADPYLRLPKGGKDRTVPVSAALVAALALHMATYPRAAAWDAIDGCAASLVFASLDGRPVIHRRMTGNLALARRKAGLPTSVTFHSFRHFFASTLIAGGHSERQVGERLGHSSAEVTRLYGGLFASADQATRSVLEAGQDWLTG